ncbi:23S rRNA (adenine(1618)-N(6))-methyltransferase RlmF [Corallincola luteus]|uniref:Ribosomal RNA large subunit methyltransferase F n=1 Tax=Corallincola luteus TaxID=1775177 RepID=A0ABY2AFM6_9GAMM|nr:23S rRNA (adenine(1618)-N(6))-methyltransferase RlmF [Corallincola luteus]TCI01175.1 23S rRNA (adenine(1618)-N(6))-methyltransferase RlmF [Corallincola luteus]
MRKNLSRNKRQSRTDSKGLHPRNKHKRGYDFPLLVKSYPPLEPHVKPNAHGNLSIQFADPKAVKALNAALLKTYYHTTDWDIPDGALCPPIPGRVDYIHYVAELLGIDEPSKGQTKDGPTISMLDIGTGASGIYPVLACQTYHWHCVGSDINSQSLDNVAIIINNNPALKERFSVRLQTDKNQFFKGIIQPGEIFDISVCNPPFHASPEEARKGSQQKLNNLARHRGVDDAAGKVNIASPALNFGGQEAELWCKGGERMFLKKLIKESRDYSSQCRWFSSLVSKIDNVKPAKQWLRKLGASDIREIEMAQGNKITRVLAWTYR